MVTMGSVRPRKSREKKGKKSVGKEGVVSSDLLGLKESFPWGRGGVLSRERGSLT